MQITFFFRRVTMAIKCDACVNSFDADDISCDASDTSCDGGQEGSFGALMAHGLSCHNRKIREDYDKEELSKVRTRHQD